MEEDKISKKRIRNDESQLMSHYDDDEGSSSGQEDDDQHDLSLLNHSNMGLVPTTPDVDTSDGVGGGRQSSSSYNRAVLRRKSKAWQCFDRGEYNKTAHRFIASCKYCHKKFDGRLPKLRSHIIECAEIPEEEKTIFMKESESEGENSDIEGGVEHTHTSRGGRGGMNENSLSGNSLLSPTSGGGDGGDEGGDLNNSMNVIHSIRRGRPASKLWECFDRGAYSKSAHRFAAVCKYCHASLDGRKHKLKNHILICSVIDMETKEIYRNINIDDGPTPKKPKMNHGDPNK
jgi:hypothetical protein